MTPTCNNEYTSSQQKAGQTWSEYAKISLDLEERRNNDDSHGRYIAFSIRDSQRIRGISAYRQALYRFRSDRGNHDRQSIQSAAICIRSIPSQTHETREPIKKASVWRQWTVEILVARFCLLRAWKQRVKKPRDSLPVTSIANDAKQVNGYTRQIRDGRRCIHE
jgi:hypothetical protein